MTVKDGVKHPFKRKLNLGQENMPWSTQVVMSSLPANQLPRSLKKDGARAVCAVESILKQQDLKLKNRHWYNTKQRYYRAEFNVRVLILAASLKFEIVGKDGKFFLIKKDRRANTDLNAGTTVSTKSDEIEVKWMQSTQNDVTHDVAPISYGLEDARVIQR